MLPIGVLLVSGFAHHATRHLPARAGVPRRVAFATPTVVADGQVSAVRIDHHVMDTTTGAASTRAGSSVIMKTSEVTDSSAFTANVLGIVGGQLGFTALAASIMAQPGPVHDLALNSSSAWPFLVFLVGLATVVAALATESLIWLGAFTATQSWLVGLIVMRYVDAGLGNLIGQAVTLTATDVLVLSAYVLSAKDNFNFLGAGLRVALWSLLAGSAVELLSIYSPFGLVVQTVPMQDLTLGVVGSIVFSLYLVYDLSMTRTEYAEDNRLVAASLNIYLDIINLFIDFLRVLGYFESEDED